MEFLPHQFVREWRGGFGTEKFAAEGAGMDQLTFYRSADNLLSGSEGEFRLLWYVYNRRFWRSRVMRK
jgi:hypothetical protein